MASTRDELVGALAHELGVAPLTPAEIESLLSLAGAAAHGTGDRTTAPLVSFLAGLAATAGADRQAALGVAQRFLPLNSRPDMRSGRRAFALRPL